MFNVHAIDEEGNKHCETDCETLADVKSMLESFVHDAGLDAPEFEEHELPAAYEAYMAKLRFGITCNGNDAIDLLCALTPSRAPAAR